MVEKPEIFQPAIQEPEILDVDLLRFERGDGAARQAVVDGVRRVVVVEKL